MDSSQINAFLRTISRRKKFLSKDDNNQVRLATIEQFRSARLKAMLDQVWAGLVGQSVNLLSYEEVREKVHAVETNLREIKEIPLDSIVGSVGRYNDFTRRFLPLVNEDEYRWARVRTLVESMEGLPPIEVYQIGEVYFVRDGNHRVSVAREMGATHIEAYVTLVNTAVPLEPNIQPNDLYIKEQYAGFLERTRLDETFPGLDLSMSAAGNYRVLEQQISVHQHWVKEHYGKDISFNEAAVRWYREIYLPIIHVIRQRGMMRDFHERTETDLYVWLDKHRHELAEKLGWSVDTETAVSDLAVSQTRDPKLVALRLSRKLRDALLPAALEAGPTVGEWRESWVANKRDDRLFNHILVAVDGKDTGWHALSQAIRIAWREQGRIFGLHVVSTTKKAKGEAAQSIKDEFERRCLEASIPGEITISTGPVTGTICYRARWADLVVVSLSHPPGPHPVDRLSSQFGQLLRRSSRPVLAVPRCYTELDRILLAYDGSPKADEALFVAIYLAKHWGVRLTAVVALSQQVTEETANHLRTYLTNQQIETHLVVEKSEPAALIMDTAQSLDCGLILMGGYGLSPVTEIMMGSTVDILLRSHNWPILICR